MSKNFLPMFSSRIFVVSNLTFRSLIHFGITFVWDVTECPNFNLFHVAVQFSLNYLIKWLSLRKKKVLFYIGAYLINNVMLVSHMISFLHCIFLPPLSKINWLCVWVYFWVLCWVWFCSVYGFSCLQKFASLIRSNLFIFAFILFIFTLGVWPKKTLAHFISECYAYVLF